MTISEKTKFVNAQFDIPGIKKVYINENVTPVSRKLFYDEEFCKFKSST